MKTAGTKQYNFLKTHQVFNTDEWEHCCLLSGYHSRNKLAKLMRDNKIRKYVILYTPLFLKVPEKILYLLHY